jgi:hypothetical protein
VDCGALFGVAVQDLTRPTSKLIAPLLTTHVEEYVRGQVHTQGIENFWSLIWLAKYIYAVASLSFGLNWAENMYTNQPKHAPKAVRRQCAGQQAPKQAPQDTRHRVRFAERLLGP